MTTKDDDEKRVREIMQENGFIVKDKLTFIQLMLIYTQAQIDVLQSQENKLM